MPRLPVAGESEARAGATRPRRARPPRRAPPVGHAERQRAGRQAADRAARRAGIGRAVGSASTVGLAQARPRARQIRAWYSPRGTVSRKTRRRAYERPRGSTTTSIPRSARARRADRASDAPPAPGSHPADRRLVELAGRKACSAAYGSSRRRPQPPGPLDDDSIRRTRTSRNGSASARLIDSSPSSPSSATRMVCATERGKGSPRFSVGEWQPAKREGTSAAATTRASGTGRPC